MSTRCPECGAPLIDGGTCMDHFHALLLLEHEVAIDPMATADGRGEIAHFYAVSSYVLQHPASMNYTAEALNDLRRMIADHLSGHANLGTLRVQIRRAVDGPVRITRRTGDEAPRWPVNSWPITVSDVVAGGIEGYGERVASWAQSIIQILDATVA